MVRWSNETQSFYWVCAWGCTGYEFETEDEAVQDQAWHDCRKAVL